MNTYDENLHDNITQSLQNQYLNALNAKSQLDTSALALFHAQDAAITAYEKETIAQGVMEVKKKIKARAVGGNNLSVNLVNSASQANGFLKASVTNASVCAANVQAAASSIVRLAGDMGGIYTMIHAADADSDMDGLAGDVFQYIKETARRAELSSLQAIEFSTLTAEVSTANVLDNANTTTGIMAGLLKTISGEFDTASQSYADANALFASASTTEKMAEGDLEDSYIDFSSVLTASRAMNTELNLNLIISQPPAADDPGKDGAADTKEPEEYNTDFTTDIITHITSDLADPENPVFTFAIQFNPIIYPFPVPADSKESPVDKYYAFFVKDEDQALFTLEEAENILMLENDALPQYVLCNAGSPNQIKIPLVIDPSNPPDKSQCDSDGDPVIPGTNYVVFILAVFDNKYKKTLNYFDDFLSAPSAPFCLGTLLNAVDPGTLKLYSPDGTEVQNANNTSQKVNTKTQYQNTKGQYKLEFSADTLNLNAPAAGAPAYPPVVQCRCFFLPYFDPAAESDANSREIPRQLLSYYQLKRYIKEADEIAEIYHYKQVDKKAISSDAYKAAQASIANDQKEFNGPADQAEQDSIAFYINLPLLESVPSSNYTVNDKYVAGKEQTATFTIDPDTTTDVFGNLLFTANAIDPSVSYAYKIVVLTVYNGLEQYTSQYNNAVSSFKNARVLTVSQDPETPDILLTISNPAAAPQGKATSNPPSAKAQLSTQSE